jgi:transposase InsO family protein
VLDAFSRRVVGWSISPNPTAALTCNALGMAIEQRDAVRGTVVHSDHGTQFTAWTFSDRARKSGLLPSMGSVGDCYDNAMMEAFWSRMQVELLDTRRWKTRVELANAIFEYIEVGVLGTPLHLRAPLRPAMPARCISIVTALWPAWIPRPSVSSAYTRLAP